MPSLSSTPSPSSREASERFAAQPTRDTKPELAVRRLIHARGLRYRVDWRLPFDRRRRADIAFPSRHVAVFIDGCWWHGCAMHYRAPKTNADWWREKVEGNRIRDRETDERLKAMGWSVIRAWEHDDPAVIADRVERVVRAGPGGVM